MDTILQKLQTYAKSLQERFDGLSTLSKFVAGLVLFTLLPCVAVCCTRWKSWVKAIVCFCLFCFLLGILMAVFVFYLIWFIWKKTFWKTYVKVITTVALIIIPLTLGIVFGEKATTSTVSPSPSISTEPPTLSANTATPLPSPTQVLPPTPTPIPLTPYQLLAQDDDAYLLFLRIVGTCYKDNSLTQEMFDEMAQYSGVQPLVEDVLNYRYQEGVLSPDFAASFSGFWTDDMLSAYPEVKDALQVSFDLNYNLVEKVWVLRENEATVTAHTSSTVYTVDGTDYYDFEGLIEEGSIIYIKDGDSMIPYQEVLGFEKNKQNGDGTIISNAVYVKELYSVFGNEYGTTRWRDLDDMLRHNKETKDNEGVPVFYVEADQ